MSAFMSPIALDALLAVGHHALVFPLVALLAAELVLLAGTLDKRRLQQLARVDGAYGASAGLLLVAGGLRAVYGAKGWAFYAGQPMFWLKISLFVLIGLLSIAPTLRIARWRKAGTPPDDAARLGVKRWVHAELGLLAFVPVAAVLMARAVGA
jgi:putative membrane protein